MAIAVLLTALVIGLAYDSARLITISEKRCPPLARLRGRKAALRSAEAWCVGLRLNGRIDAGIYQRRMAALARGHRVTSAENSRNGSGHGRFPP